MNKRKSPFPLRLPDEVYRFIKNEADEQGRSMNKQVSFFLKEKMNEYKKAEA